MDIEKIKVGDVIHDIRDAGALREIEGKGLSTNDYTNADKSKLEGIEANAQKNKIESIKVNGSDVTPDANKAVNLSVPTKMSDLNLDGGDMASGASLRFKNASSSMVIQPFGIVKESNEQSHLISFPDRGGTVALTSDIPDVSGKQDTIQDLSEIRSGAALGATAYQKPSAGIPSSDMTSAVQNSLQLADSSVQAEPIGSIIPPVNPSEFATKEKVDQLSQKVGDFIETDVKTNFVLPNYIDSRYINYNNGSVYDSQRPISILRFVDVSDAVGKEMHYGRVTFNYSSNLYGLAFYDSAQNYISGVNSLYDSTLDEPTMEDYIVQVPVNAKYASFTVPTIFKATFEAFYFTKETEYLNGLGKDVTDLLDDVSVLKQPRDIEIFEDNVVGRYYAEAAAPSHRFNVLYRVLPGSIQQIRMKTGYQCVIRYKDINGTTIKDHGWITATRPDYSFTPPIDVIVADILFEKMDGTPLISGGYTTKRDAINANLEICKIESYEIVERNITSVKDWAFFEYIRRKERRSIRSVAHQGYFGYSGGYGNNMAQYYAKAAKYGFDFGECDIKFSSDNVPVCCHDATFTDEDSGTTITIANKTVAELKEYNYHGGKISTFEEVLMTCKVNGLGLYIDHFANANTSEKKATLFSLVKKYSMERRVAWLINSGATSIADAILEWDAQASISVLATELGDALVTEVNSLKTASNEIRLSLDYSNILVSDIETYSARLKPGIVIEVWTVDDIKSFKEYLPFVAAITSNRYSESMVAL